MVAIGAAVVFVWPVIDPPNIDNLTTHLYVTGYGAALLGLGLGRLPIGHE